MKPFLLLLSSFLLFQVSLGFEQVIVSCPTPTSPSSLLSLSSLQKEQDLRVILENNLLLISSPSSFPSLLSSYSPSCHLLSPFLPSSHSYFLLERPFFDPLVSSFEADWAFKVLEVSASLGFSLLFSSPRCFLFSSKGEFPSESLFSLFPKETDVTPFPLQKILPPSSSSFSFSSSPFYSKKSEIGDLVDQVDIESLLNYDLYLSGERNDSSINSRNSHSPEILGVAEWIKKNFEEHGQQVNLEEFRSDMGPNVIGYLRGVEEPEKFVIIGAHYDSRAFLRTSPTQRAPGANDDGSGSSILLELSRIISKNRLRFRYSVIFGAWCGEEQGLVGSRDFAQQCKERDMEIVGMIQGDMLGFRREGEKPQCAFPDRYHSPQLTSYLKQVVTTFVPELMVCDTPVCCSDHQSFYEQGFPATWFFERCGGIADDQYHQEGDVVNRPGFDPIQWQLNAKAMFASLLSLAQLV